MFGGLHLTREGTEMDATQFGDVWWLVFGLAAQFVFALRFIWQWIVSERRKESVIPVGFWYFSLAGGLMLTVYAIFRDRVLIPGQVAGVAIYVRNLMLIHRSREAKQKAPETVPFPSRPEGQTPVQRAA